MRTHDITIHVPFLLVAGLQCDQPARRAAERCIKAALPKALPNEYVFDSTPQEDTTP